MTKNSTNVSANELDKLVMDEISKYEVSKIMPDMELVGIGQQMEVMNQTGQSNLYYQWLACLTKLIKPKQVVELGAAAGISTIMIASELDKDAKFYSVDNDPQAWRWMKKEYPQVTKILSDDLDMRIWRGINLKDTDLWFIDSLHTYDQLNSEMKKYRKYFKKGAVVVFDDIRMPGLWEIWSNLPYDKQENTNPCHYSGFGFCII